MKILSAVESVATTLTAMSEHLQGIAKTQERQALAAERQAAASERQANALEEILLNMNFSGTM